MNLQHTQIYRFLLNVQTEYEYEGWNTFEWKSPCTCKTRYDSSRHNTTHRNQRKVWTNNIHFCRVYIYIWKGLESTEYLLRWSGSQNKRTHEREWESTIPYRSSQQWPRATLTFTAEWTKLWPKQQRSRCRRSQIRWSVSKYVGGKTRFVTKVQAGCDSNRGGPLMLWVDLLSIRKTFPLGCRRQAVCHPPTCHRLHLKRERRTLRPAGKRCLQAPSVSRSSCRERASASPAHLQRTAPGTHF